ncbi:sensor histidine kinase [Arvimicrobium flavum]|uniref:sensor histidine kinase n=1 Tax=Arvimicrobium flavum TaxID=3393320 RepID=UPI00237B0CCE|nr:HAMP domain-containing sensor histidine kinase [Mesorhizobium shangrilense]
MDASPPTEAATGSDVGERTSVPLARGLSAKLLMLTVVFVMVAEVLIFVPSIANFRIRWLEERLATAAAVSIVLLQNDAAETSPSLQKDVLLAIGAKAIAVRDENGVSRLLAVSDMPQEVDQHINVDVADMPGSVAAALDTLFSGGKRMIRVFGTVGESDKVFELIMPDWRLRNAMLAYSRNVALVSLLLSVFTAVLVYAAIDRIMIRPIRGMTSAMLAFSRAPDEPGSIVRPADRTDEIGVAEHELAGMQTTLQKMLAERKHLADLGLAVSKINHDMRNMLASAQLLSDRLRTINDPTVQSLAPKLVRTLDRAVAYSSGVLAYGRTHEPPPSRRRLKLGRLVEDVHDALGGEASGIEFVNAVEPAFEVDADAEQLFRVLFNLCRNAIQAMAGDVETAIVRRLTISAGRTGSVSRILVADTGPGLPKKALENLFTAFHGSARSGGTGLGLAIAHELVRAHGGALELVESIGGRTVFSVTIPDQPVNLEEARGALRRPA